MKVERRPNRADPCTPNVTIVVTPEPQATLDSIALAAPFW